MEWILISNASNNKIFVSEWCYFVFAITKTSHAIINIRSTHERQANNNVRFK